MKTARLLGLVLTVAAAGGLLTACELPLVFVVNSTVDAVDADPGDGECETATEGECTLRAAIQEASTLPGAVAIDLTAGETYELTLAGTDDDLGVSGDLDTWGNIVIRGHGARVDANQLDRVLDHHAGVLFLLDVTLEEGHMSHGAGIRNAADLHLIDSRVTDLLYFVTVDPQPTGAIYHTAGTLSIARSSVGGLLNFGSESGGVVQLGGTVKIVDSIISGNGSVEQSFALNQLGGSAFVLNSSLNDFRLTFPVPICNPSGCFPVTFLSAPAKIDGSATIIRSTLDAASSGTPLSGDGVVTASGSVIFGRCEPEVSSLGYNAFDNRPNPCADPPHPTDLILDHNPLSLGIPLVGSPVVDAIPVGTPVLCSAPNDHDRRQLPRPVGAGCDIGAIERQPDDPTG